MIVLSIYLAILYTIGFIEFKKAKNVKHYVISSKNASWYLVGGSIIASCIGGSATIGMVGLSYEVGFPAVWWLLSGACGLIILSVFLVKKVSSSKALTMPEMLEHYIGKKARFVASIIIVIAWGAILAAQFSAGARIISAITEISFESSLLASAIIIITYSILGGQASILRSDLAQICVIILSFLMIFFWFILIKNANLGNVKFELFNSNFGFDKWSYFMIILGGSYVVCPMLFGRLLSAKDEFHAKAGAIFGVAGIAFGAILIVIIGLLSKEFISSSELSDTILTNEIYSILPIWLGILLLVALLSAIISSADSCLITASSVFCNDILKTNSLKIYRIFTVLFGIMAFCLTFWGKSILGFLLTANDIYVSGVVATVFIAMLSKRKINENIAIIAMLIGGLFGLLGTLSDEKVLAIVGVFLALFISTVGCLYKNE